MCNSDGIECKYVDNVGLKPIYETLNTTNKSTYIFGYELSIKKWHNAACGGQNTFIQILQNDQLISSIGQYYIKYKNYDGTTFYGESSTTSNYITVNNNGGQMDRPIESIYLPFDPVGVTFLITQCDISDYMC